MHLGAGESPSHAHVSLRLGSGVWPLPQHGLDVHSLSHVTPNQVH